MKSFLSLLLFTVFTCGVSFTQNNNQKEKNQTDEKTTVSPVDLKTESLEKPKSIVVKSELPTEKPLSENLKTDTLSSSENKDYPVSLSSGTKRSERKPEVKTVDSEIDKTVETKQQSPKPSKQADFSDKRIYEKVEIRKEIKNDQVILYLPNKKRNIQPEKINSYINRLKNNYDVISDITYSEKDNEFRIFFNEINITENTYLLNEVLLHFAIKDYSINK